MSCVSCAYKDRLVRQGIPAWDLGTYKWLPWEPLPEADVFMHGRHIGVAKPTPMAPALIDGLSPLAALAVETAVLERHLVANAGYRATIYAKASDTRWEDALPLLNMVVHLALLVVNVVWRRPCCYRCGRVLW